MGLGQYICLKRFSGGLELVAAIRPLAKGATILFDLETANIKIGIWFCMVKVRTMFEVKWPKTRLIACRFYGMC